MELLVVGEPIEVGVNRPEILVDMVVAVVVDAIQ